MHSISLHATHEHNGLLSLPLSPAGAVGRLMGEGNVFPFQKKP